MSRTASVFCVFVAALLCASTARAQHQARWQTKAEALSSKADDVRIEAMRIQTTARSQDDLAEANEKFAKAMSLYREALKKNPDLVSAASGFGLAGLARRDYPAVIQTVGPVYQRHPDQTDLGYSFGYALFKERKYQQAVPILEKVSAAMKPDQLIVHFFLANYYLYVQRGAPAVRELKRYFKLRPPAAAANDFRFERLLGEAYLLMKDADHARQAFETAQSGRPESLPLQLGLESVLELEGHSQKAVALLRHLTTDFPTSAEPYLRLGKLLLASGDVAHAQIEAKVLSLVADTSASHLLMGRVLLALEKPKAAEKELRRAWKLDPSSLEAEIALAKAVQDQGRNQEAVSLLEKAVRGGARTVSVYAALGSTYRRAGRFQDAVKMHQKVVALAPKRALGKILLGADHFATGEWDAAISDYAAAMKLEPKNAHARHWLAISLLERGRERARSGDLESAARDLRRALDLDHQEIIARSLGAVLLSAKDWAEAQSVLAQAITLPGAGWQAHFLYGYALLGKHDAARAKDAFEKAATFAKDSDDLGRVYAGWALANLELGKFDTAVKKLREERSAKLALKITQDNLPMALLRRALSRLQSGNVDGASADLKAADHLMPRHPGPMVTGVRRFVAALLDVEHGQYRRASGALRTALRHHPKWADSNDRGLLEAYVAYRSGNTRRARKHLAAAARHASGVQKEWATQLSRGIDRREGELAYTHHRLRASVHALSSALRNDPLNPYVINNLACARYAQRHYAPAVAGWKKVADALPVADYNLALASSRKRNPRETVVRLARYTESAKGSRAVRARGWKDRLEMIYGISEPHVHAPSSTVVPASSEQK